MPHGQWVAFDGDESVHECGQISEYHSELSAHASPPRPAYPSSPPASSMSPRPSINASLQSQASGIQPQSPTTPSTTPQPAKSEGLPAWIWWVIAIVILYLMFKK